MNLDEYKSFLIDLEKYKSELVFPNDGPDHAEILMTQIFNSTKEEISLLSGALGSILTSREKYLKSLRDLLDRNVKVRVILVSKKPDSVDSEALKLLRSRDVSILVLNEKQSEDYKAFMGNDEVHFCYSDKIRFRFEYDPLHYKAHASFNNKKMVQELEEIFDNVYDKFSS